MEGERVGGRRGQVINLARGNILQMLFSNHILEIFLYSRLRLIIILIYQYLLAKKLAAGRQNFKKIFGRTDIKWSKFQVPLQIRRR